MPTSTRTRQRKIKHVKHVRSRGSDYYYFITGQKDPLGKAIFARLPDINDPSFWPTYAGLCGAKDKRREKVGILMLPAFVALFQRGEKWRSFSKATQEVYGTYLGQLAAAFNTAPADEITTKDMVRLVDSMADRPGAANMLLKATGSLYAWGRKREHVSKDTRPCEDIDPFELGEHDPWPQALLEKALASDDEMIRLAVHLLYYTGQRIGDVTMMRWADYRNGRIEIVQEKTGHDVSIPPHPALKELLATTRKAGLTILARDSAKPYTREAVRDRIQKWAKQHGHTIVPHGLRKNAVNALLEAGCSAAETASITKQSLSLVEHYAKARDARRLADSAVLRWSGSKK